MKLIGLATSVFAATACLAAPVRPKEQVLSTRDVTLGPKQCGHKVGGMWIPAHRGLDGSCPEESDIHGRGENTKAMPALHHNCQSDLVTIPRSSELGEEIAAATKDRDVDEDGVTAAKGHRGGTPSAHTGNKPHCGRFIGPTWVPLPPRECRGRDDNDKPKNKEGDRPNVEACSDRPCRVLGETGVPLPPDPNCKRPSGADHVKNKSDARSLETRNLPPCGRLIGEMWVPVPRKPNGKCPTGSDIGKRGEENENVAESPSWLDPVDGAGARRHA